MKKPTKKTKPTPTSTDLAKVRGGVTISKEADNSVAAHEPTTLGDAVIAGVLAGLAEKR